MDNTIIKNINDKVKENDVLYHLGDFCFGPKDDNKYMQLIEKYRNSIKCKNLSLIFGNHDRKHLKSQYEKIFTSVSDYHEIKLNGMHLILSHFPMRSWNKVHRGSYMLYGHVHGKLFNEDSLSSSLTLDVGVDTHNFNPWNIVEINNLMKIKQTNKTNK